LACEALSRLVYLSAARSPHTVDVELFRLGWHNDPEDLQQRLQRAIDAAAEDEERSYDAVVMAYGLCGRATAGITARGVPLVLPRAHDCITLFLGGRGRYQREFTDHPGTYWYVRDYVERKSGNTALSLGAEGYENVESQYDDYVAKYGKDNADYLMEVMGAWREHYNRAAYIDMGVADSSAVEAETRDEAQRRGWSFEKLAGDRVLVRRLLEGDWDDDFLIVQPGASVTMVYDERVVACGPLVEGAERP
jgi:hypothetical protein